MYKAEIVNSGDSSFKVKTKDYEFSIDTEGQGVTPPDTLLAALGSCIGVYIRKYAKGAGLDLKDFSVTVEAEFSKESPVCFRHIDASLDLKGLELDDRRKSAFLSFIKNCPVHNTLKGNPQVEIRLS